MVEPNNTTVRGRETIASKCNLSSPVVVVTAGVVVAAAGVDVVTRHLDLAAAQAHAAILVVADPNSCCKDDSDEQPHYIQGKQSKTVMTYLLYKMF
jgi:hypothetical protein